MNPDTTATPAPITRAEAFRFWLKLGFISFGGPAGQIAIMHAELVERRRWISEKRFLHALNFCMLLPGPDAQQLASHHQNNYGGAVKRLNAIRTQLAATPHASVPGFQVYGHEVGRSTAMRLRAMGLDARYLRGGFDGWQAAGRPVEAKPPRLSR